MKHGILYKLGCLSCVSLCLLFLCSSVLAAGAEETFSEDELNASYAATLGEDYVPAEEDPASDQADSQVVYTEENPLYVQVTSQASTDNSSVVEPADDAGDYGISPLALSPVTSEDTSGLKAVLLEILGPYEPILFEYQYGSSNTGREVFQDDVWLCSFWMLAIMVYSIFRLLGGWLLRKQ